MCAPSCAQPAAVAAAGMVHFDFTLGKWKPLVMYSRRAPKPLPAVLTPDVDSWEVLGTNLSYKDNVGSWATDSNRLLICDRRDFNKLGVGLDDLIDSFIQTVCSTVAIDSLASKLVSGESGAQQVFNRELFESLNKDAILAAEICSGPDDCKQLDDAIKVEKYVPLTKPVPETTEK